MSRLLERIFLHPLGTTRPQVRQRHLGVERLEERVLLSISVTSDADTGALGTLRWAIETANNQVTNPGHDEIVILDQSRGVHHIDLQSELPPIWDGVTIRSESGEYVTIDAQDYSQGANDDGLVVSINSGRDLDTWIQDLDFANVTGDTFRLEGVDGQNVTLHHCCVDLGVTGTGMRVGPGDASILIDNCIIINKETGIRYEGDNSSLTIQNCVIDSTWEPEWDPDFAATGIRADDATGNLTIQYNTIYKIPGNGIYLNGSSSTAFQAQIVGNVIGGLDQYNHSRPIGGTGVTLEDWRGAIDPNDGSDMSFLLGNTITYNTGSATEAKSGVVLDNCQQVSVVGNEVAYSSANGVVIHSPDDNMQSQNIKLWGNVVHDNAGDGIALSTPSWDGYVSNIDIGPLVLARVGGGYDVYDSYVQDNGGSGISMTSDSSPGAIHDVYIGPDQTTGLGYNYIMGNGAYGIDVHESSDIDIECNYIGTDGTANLGNAAGGIRLITSVEDVFVVGNLIAYNGESGVGAGIEIGDSGTLNWTTHRNCFSQNAYLANEEAAVKIADGTQDGLLAPQITESFFNQESGNWIIPVSLDPPSGFAGAEFRFELYTYDPATDAYAYYDDRTGTIPASGPYSDSFTVPVEDLAEGEYLTVVAICADATYTDYVGDTSEFCTPVEIQEAATIQDRHVFYNDSWLDGNNAAANANDDNAIDADKEAWIPGETLGNNHTTGYSKGINGVMVDIENLADPGGLSADDFAFQYVVGGTWTDWTGTPTVAVRTGAGTSGSDRVTLIFPYPGNPFYNNWMKVTVLATDDTGLQDPDVFCFGNLPGDANGDRFVGGADLDIVRANWGLTGRWVDQGDINLDNFVGGSDLDMVRAYWGVSLAAPPSEGDKMMSGGGGELYTSSWSKEVDEVFFHYGFGDDDPTNDVAPGDKLWDQFVDELFTTVKAALDRELAATSLTAG